MKEFDVIVVGGGASGLMAAGKAAESGANTLLMEKMDKPGRKIFLTGKFRCNLTNTAPIPEFINHFGSNGRFLRQAFHRFFSDDLIRFFNGLGVPTVVERGGRVFPASSRSTDVVSALLKWCRIGNVEIKNLSPIENILVENGNIIGVKTHNNQFYGKKVIIATGGASYPGTGSTGDGYELAKDIGHSVVPIRPSLVPLTTVGDLTKRLQGLSLKNVNVSVMVNGKKSTQDFGEMLFTHFGVSGPIILTISRFVVDALNKGDVVVISIDLKPALDHRKLDTRLLRDLNFNGSKQFQTYLKDLLPAKLIPICIEFTDIPGEKRCNQITTDDRRALRMWLKDFRLKISGHRGFRHAIITAGGIDTIEVNPRTMESRLIQGLYFAGEILDIDADTGGYNLQAAFSTGWIAGESSAHRRKR